MHRLEVGSLILPASGKAAGLRRLRPALQVRSLCGGM